VFQQFDIDQMFQEYDQNYKAGANINTSSKKSKEKTVHKTKKGQSKKK